jgi:preprotein translocase subunit SecA
MGYIHNTFTERFLRAQITFEQPRPLPPMFLSGDDDPSGGNGAPRPRGPSAPTRRFNALGVLEDVPAGEGEGIDATLDIGPAEAPERGTVVRQEPTVHVGGKSAPLSKAMAAAPIPGVAGATGNGKDWSNVGRNDPCPCGSGKKFKKCHGATL